MGIKAGTKLGRYEIRLKIGEGGMGEVYMALDTKLDRSVALKVLTTELAANEDRMRRLVQEARTASALNHPNIITIYEIDETDFGHFIATEFIDGETVRDRLRNAPMSVADVLDTAIQIASALAAAHAAGIIHRDIKPDNVMLRHDGIVKVLDFGLAKLTDTRTETIDREAATRAMVQTAPGIVMGTVSYMSPEQARGKQVDARTDVWSLGVVMYEMLTRQLPFQGETISDRIAAILRSDVAPLTQFDRSIPAELERIVMKALRKEPAERYETADALLHDLRGLKKQLEFSAELKRSQSHGQQAEADTQLVKVVTDEHADARKTMDRFASDHHSVGRERERAELRATFESVSAGRGFLVCVAGEPGIGKTTVIEDFLAELGADRPCTVARGRCSERLAGTEAYLPLLEALESLLRDSSDARALMKQIAPTWYAQLVPLSGEHEESARLMNEARAPSQERMKRELASFLQQVSAQRPLVLFFDDLHWADVSTIDVLSFLAGKFDAMRALVVTAYRPSDMLLNKHPFLQIKPDLQARGVCRELRLEFLNESDIADYLALEFPGHRFTPKFPQLIHAKTEGSPLFMSDLVHYLRDRGVIAQSDGTWTLAQELPDVERELPESVRGMIERKIAQLGEEDHKLLVTASVQGYEFDSAVVARVMKVETDEIEDRLEALERVQTFVKLVDEREFPDRTLALRYRFVHVLYQNALYSSLRATRKVSLSREVAETLETFYAEKRTDAASELAALWEAARQYAKAAEYFTLAAQRANQVMAAQEAAVLARRGLTMIENLPESHERQAEELSLQIVLGNALFATKGYAAPEVEETFARAYQLAQQLDDPQLLLPLIWGIYAVNFCRAKYRNALANGEEFVRLAEKVNPPALVIGHAMVGSSLFWLGELAEALARLQKATALYSPEEHRPLTFMFGHEPGMYAEVYVAFALWLLGYADQALEHTNAFLRYGFEVGQAQSKAFALSCGATVHQWRRDVARVVELADEAIAFSSEQGLPFWLGISTMSRGWSRVENGDADEGMAEIHGGLDLLRSTGAEITVATNLCRLGEAYQKAGKPREGLDVLKDDPAWGSDGEERCWQADLGRVRAELLLAAGGDMAEVEALLHEGIEIAQLQKAKSLELRATMSLARLWHAQGKSADAKQILARVYDWFTEGFDTADLRDARDLLAQLEQPSDSQAAA